MSNLDIKAFMEEIEDIRKTVFEDPESETPPPRKAEPEPDKQVGPPTSSLPAIEEFVSNLAAAHPGRRFIVFAESCANALVGALDGFRTGLGESSDKDTFQTIDEMRKHAQSIAQGLHGVARVARFAPTTKE